MLDKEHKFVNIEILMKESNSVGQRSQGLDYDLRIIYDFYKSFDSECLEDVDTSRKKLQLLSVPSYIMISMCETAAEIFSEEPVMLEIVEDCVVLGDIHGHILDLLRFFAKLGWPPNKKYLFLGDIVDRGEFSIETATIVFGLKVLFPQHVNIIRGNHEFPDMYRSCGFSSELESIYHDPRVEESFTKMFSFLPLSARINQKILCLHGGIGPSIKNISSFSTLGRPIFSSSSDIILSMVWSDPSEYITGFQVSPRGNGYYFGGNALTEFLESCGSKWSQYIVR